MINKEIDTVLEKLAAVTSTIIMVFRDSEEAALKCAMIIETHFIDECPEITNPLRNIIKRHFEDERINANTNKKEFKLLKCEMCEELVNCKETDDEPVFCCVECETEYCITESY